MSEEGKRIENLENALGQIGEALGTITKKLDLEEKELTVKQKMDEEISAVYESADEKVKEIREKYAPLIKSYNREHDIIKKGGKIIGKGTRPFASLWNGIKEGASED